MQLISYFAALTIFTFPAIGFAQEAQTTGAVHESTRADVRNQLVALEQAGFHTNDGYHYPENLQAAERKVSQQNEHYPK